MGTQTRPLQQISGCGSTVLVFGVILLVVALVVKGAVWISRTVYPWLILADVAALAACVVIFLPLAVFRKTRKIAAGGILFASFLFALSLWTLSVIVTYRIAGNKALLIGLFLAVVGVIPIAYIAAVMNLKWMMLGQLVLLTVLTFGTRSVANFLASKSPEDE